MLNRTHVYLIWLAGAPSTRSNVSSHQSLFWRLESPTASQFPSACLPNAAPSGAWVDAAPYNMIDYNGTRTHTQVWYVLQYYVLQ